jgi:ribonucleoside-diphosphate reductase beta chain
MSSSLIGARCLLTFRSCVDFHTGRCVGLLSPDFLARAESPELFDADLEKQIVAMIGEAVDCETAFAEDLLDQGIAELSLRDMRAYLESVADQRLQAFGIKKRYGTCNPFSFMELQDVQELANFFERRVSAYQIAASGSVALHEEF